LPESAFKPYASVETSILLLKRKTKVNNRDNKNIFFGKAKTVGRKPTGDPLFKRGEHGKLVLDNNLEDISIAWKEFNKNPNIRLQIE